jgi:SdrD B-like domain
VEDQDTPLRCVPRLPYPVLTTMARNQLLALASAALFAGAAAAQSCSIGLFPLTIVDAAGVAFPRGIDAATGEFMAFAPSENVYLAFDPAMPSGTYYVHVTDTPFDGLDEVLSTNDPMDRFVSVTNTAGVITLALPFTTNPDPGLFGVAPGGGQSLRLSPFRVSQLPGALCRFKAWAGDKWDLSAGPANPYLLQGGLHPTTGQCAVLSFEKFRIGDGTGGDLLGSVFADLDSNGVRDPGESGFAGQQVRLVTGSSAVLTITDQDGNYRFDAVAAGNYTVEFTVPSGYVSTTPTSFALEVCGCADVTVSAFGAAQQVLSCNARTIGYWRNVHGLQNVQQYGILATLPMLNLRDALGNHVAPGSLQQFKAYLQGATAYNMAYMLSAQLVAMHCNVIVGFVHPSCVIDDSSLGELTIAQLMQQSVASLLAHPFTPPGSQHRAAQQQLKNALDRANNNLNWR